MLAEHTTGYLIHNRPYLEKKHWLTFLTKDYGLISCLKHLSTKQPLDIFQPLSFMIALKNQRPSVQKIELDGFLPPLASPYVWAGLYFNELLYKLLEDLEYHQDIYTLYHESLQALSQKKDFPPIVRRFEHFLQTFLGYGLSFSAIEQYPNTSTWYFDLQEGLSPKARPLAYTIPSAVLLKLRDQCWDCPQVQKVSKHLFHTILKELLGPNALFMQNILPQSLR